MAASPSGSLRVLLESFQVRYIGLGFLWSWRISAWAILGVLAGGEGIGILSCPAWVPATLATIACFVVFASIFEWRRVKVADATVCGLVAMASGSTVLLGANYLLGWNLAWVDLVGGCLFGLAEALIFLLWAQVYTKIAEGQIESLIPACGVVTLLCVLITPNMQVVAAWIATCVLPLISGAMLLLGRTGSAVARGDSGSDGCSESRFCTDVGRGGLLNQLRIGVALCAAFAVISYSSGNPDLVPQSGYTLIAYVPTLIGAVLAIGLSLMTSIYSVHIDIAGQFRWISPLIVIAGLLLMRGSQVAIFLADIACHVTDIMLVITIFVSGLVGMGRKGSGAVLAIGLSLAACKTGLFIGNIAGMWTGAGGESTEAALSVLVGLFVVAAALIPKIGSEDVLPCAAGDSGNGGETVLAVIVERYGLTPREVEIAELLYKGRSIPYIRDRILLSKNTVSTHTKSIYRKLDVHSRQELIDLIDSA